MSRSQLRTEAQVERDRNLTASERAAHLPDLIAWVEELRARSKTRNTGATMSEQKPEEPAREVITPGGDALRRDYADRKRLGNDY